MDNEFLKLLKDQLIKYAIKQILGEAVGGIKLFITTQIATYLFDKIIAPVVVWTHKEGMIAVDAIAVKKAVGKYKNAVAKIDRITNFDNLP